MKSLSVLALALVDADTLDDCCTEAGPTARAVCARLVRQLRRRADKRA
ncbi:MAG: hypothetical protein RLT05_14815 [Bauldia litoralis]